MVSSVAKILAADKKKRDADAKKAAAAAAKQKKKDAALAAKLLKIKKNVPVVKTTAVEGAFNPHNIPVVTRFPRLLTPKNIADQMIFTTHRVEGIISSATPVASDLSGIVAEGSALTPIKKGAAVSVPGNKYSPDGQYYSLIMDFALGNIQDKAAGQFMDPKFIRTPKLSADEIANWGTGWGNPLVDPSTQTPYLMRIRITQHRVEPLLSGFRYLITYPPLWQLVDGRPAWDWVEASSNPLIIIRIFISPDKIEKGYKQIFGASVTEMVTGY